MISSICYLPAEILGSVFLYAVSPSKPSPVVDWSEVATVPQTLRAINLVSTFWRDVALGHQILWSRIPILLKRCSPGPPPLELVTMLGYSGQAPLSVFVNIEAKRGRDVAVVMAALQPHMHRVKSLHVFAELEADLARVFPLAAPMPMLSAFSAVIAPGTAALSYSPIPLSRLLPTKSSTTHRQRLSLDYLHLELDAPGLRLLGQHVHNVRTLCLGYISGYRTDHDTPPTELRGVESLIVRDTIVLNCKARFPDVKQLVIEAKGDSSAVTDFGDAFPSLRCVSVGPLHRYDPGLIITGAEAIQTKGVSELHVDGEYGASEILSRAFHSVDGTLLAPCSLRRIVIDGSGRRGRSVDPALYMENRARTVSVVRDLLSCSPGIHSITWVHGAARMEPTVDETFAGDIQSMKWDFGARFIWSPSTSNSTSRSSTPHIARRKVPSRRF